MCIKDKIYYLCENGILLQYGNDYNTPVSFGIEKGSKDTLEYVLSKVFIFDITKNDYDKYSLLFALEKLKQNGNDLIDGFIKVTNKL